MIIFYGTASDILEIFPSGRIPIDYMHVTKAKDLMGVGRGTSALVRVGKWWVLDDFSQSASAVR